MTRSLRSTGITPLKDLPSSLVQLRSAVWTGDTRDTRPDSDIASFAGSDRTIVVLRAIATGATASAFALSATNKIAPKCLGGHLVLWRGSCWVSNVNRPYRTLPGWDSRSRRSQ
jgi:hypothetical protein